MIKVPLLLILKYLQGAGTESDPYTTEGTTSNTPYLAQYVQNRDALAKAKALEEEKVAQGGRIGPLFEAIWNFIKNMPSELEGE